MNKDRLAALSKDELADLRKSGDLLVVPLEEAPDDFLAYVADHAAAWLGEERGKTLDARRLVDGNKWKVPVITSEVLPKALLLATSRWGAEEFAAQAPHLGLDQFYQWPAVNLDYHATFELVFSFSGHYHGTMVSVTDHCNLRCRGCSYHGDDPRYSFAATRNQRPRQEISDEHYYKFLNELPEGTDLLFCGSGELFVSRKAMPYIREAAARKLYLRILTNGMLLTPEMSDELLDLDVGAIIFSIDGHTKEMVEAIRIGIDFDLVRQNLRYLIERRDQRDSGMSIGIHCGLFEEVIPHQDEVLNYWKEFGVDFVAFFKEKTDWHTSVLPSEREGLPASNLPCFNALTSPILLTNGLVAPCPPTFQAEWSSEPMDWLKSIADESLDDIVRYYRKLRMDPKSPYRKRCAICTGKYGNYTTDSYDNVSVEAVRFTDRRTKCEAAYIRPAEDTVRPAPKETAAAAAEATPKTGPLQRLMRKVFGS